MRALIAQAAARLMAEDGLDDFGAAKRKAARQVGAPDTRNLPDNSEVEQALRDYQQLYQAGEQTQRLRSLRSDALALMERLERFDPHLVGPVLGGSAGRYAVIDLHLFTDEPKELEFFLLDRGLEFRLREQRFSVGGETRVVPGYELPWADTQARLSVFSARDLRAPIRTGGEGRPLERCRAAALRALLDGQVEVGED